MLKESESGGLVRKMRSKHHGWCTPAPVKNFQQNAKLPKCKNIQLLGGTVSNCSVLINLCARSQTNNFHLFHLEIFWFFVVEIFDIFSLNQNCWKYWSRSAGHKENFPVPLMNILLLLINIYMWWIILDLYSWSKILLRLEKHWTRHSKSSKTLTRILISQ